MAKYGMCVFLFLLGLLHFSLALKKESSEKFSLRHYLFARGGAMGPSKETAIANGVVAIVLAIVCSVVFFFLDK